MPTLETTGRYQRAALWALSGRDDDGKPVLAAPVDVGVRWVTGRKETLDRQGNTQALDATVVVDRKIALGSLMWLAPDANVDAVEQWYGVGSAGPDVELMEVKTYSETPDIKGREVYRTVGLLFSANKLPG